MSIRWAGLVLAVMLLPASVRAQESELQLRLLPEYRACVVAGVRYACYTEMQQAQLNALEITTRGLQADLRVSESLRVDLDRLVLNLTGRITQYEQAADIFREQNAELTRRLMLEIEAKNQYRTEAEQEPEIWPILVGVAVGLLGLGLGVGIAVAN